MCLQNEGRITKAKEDIVCWKICRLIYKETRNRKKLYKIASQYNHKQQTVYVKGGKQKASGFPRMKEACKDGSYLYHENEKGFHAYLTREDAEKFMGIAHKLSKYILLKCIVPKGTRFITGVQIKLSPHYSDRRREFKGKGIRAEYMIHGVE
jgi:hypothetical protein